jgi:hypothetical protein
MITGVRSENEKHQAVCNVVCMSRMSNSHEVLILGISTRSCLRETEWK